MTESEKIKILRKRNAELQEELDTLKRSGSPNISELNKELKEIIEDLKQKSLEYDRLKAELRNLQEVFKKQIREG